jgi:hypothetical protein
VSRADYAGTGTTGPFPFSFRIQASDHLRVTKTTAAGVVSTLTLTTDYTISGVGSLTGGSVTTVAAVAVGDAISLRRVVPITQLADLRNQGNFYADTLEDALDLTVEICQQQQEQLDRAIVFPEGDTASAVLPSASERASKNLGCDSAGNIIVGSSSTVAISSAMAAVVQAATLALARAAMGPWGDVVTSALVTATNGTLARSLAARFADVKNVKDFGALGDGVTNDTAAIQLAVNGGGHVWFPSGTYQVSGVAGSRLNIPSNTFLDFDPWAKMRMIAHGASTGVLLYLIDTDNVIIRGGEFVGDKAGSAGIGVGLYTGTATRCMVYGGQYTDFTTDGIILGASGTNNPSTQCHLYGVICKANKRNGLSVTSCTHSSATGCLFQANGGASPQCGVDIEPDTALYASDFRLIGCNALSNLGDGFKIQAGLGGGSYSRRITLEGCQSYLNGVNGFTNNQADSVTLTGCAAETNGQDGLSVAAGSDRMVINGFRSNANTRYAGLIAGATGLVVNGFAAEGGQYGLTIGTSYGSIGGISVKTPTVGAGVTLDTCNELSVAGLTASGAAQEGLYVNTCTDISLAGVVCRGNGADGVKLTAGAGVSLVGAVCRNNTGRGIQTTSTLDRYVIQGCIAQGNTTAQITDSASGVNKSVTGNVTT